MRRGLDVHWAFMYARDLDAAFLVDALAVGSGGYCSPRRGPSRGRLRDLRRLLRGDSLLRRLLTRFASASFPASSLPATSLTASS